MTQATRCHSCGTVFRVVADQLRVSEGWVRCGRCNAVFNAAEHVLDLDQPRTEEGGFGRRLGDLTDGWTPADEWRGPERRGGKARPAPVRPAGADSEPPLVDDPSLRFGPDEGDAGARAGAVDQRGADAADPVAPGGPRETGAAAGPGGAPVDPPAFVRRAERAARWRTSRARARLAVGVLLLAAALLVQTAHAYRDLVAARWPPLKPLLAQLCGAVPDCTIGAPRTIDDLAVESSGLVRVDRSDTYRFSVALRNRGGGEVALPAVELAITDLQGRLIARRVLLPRELGAAQTTLAAGRDLLLQASLRAGGEPVAGYTIDLFYP